MDEKTEQFQRKYIIYFKHLLLIWGWFGLWTILRSLDLVDVIVEHDIIDLLIFECLD